MAKKVPFSYRYPSPCGSACRRWPSPSLQPHLQGVQLFCVQFPYTISETMVSQDRLGTNRSGESETSKVFVSFAPSVVNAAGASKDPHGLAVAAVQASAVSEAGRSAAQRKPTVPCRKNNAVFWSGLLLVPSLSWQIDRVLHQTMVPKTHCYAPHARSGRP